MFLCGNVDAAAQEQPNAQRTLSSVARAIVSIPEAVLVNEFASGENAGVVYYAVCATVGDFTWVVRRRYRDFSKLHRKLISQCPEYSVEDIPSKTIFRASPDLVSRRRLQLEKFLQGVVKSEPLATSECTLQFFTPNRERRLLTVYPGAAVPNADYVAEVSKSDARSGACARQDATSVDAAADRFAVDWSGVDWTAAAGEDDGLSESASQRSPSSTSMAPMGDDAGVVIAALSQRLRQEQSRSQALQRELQVLRSSEALTFDIQAAAEAQKFVKRQLVQVPAPEIFFLFDLQLPLPPLAVNQAEEKAQALADACCDLVVTACQLLQVSNCLALEQPSDSPRLREERLHEVEQMGYMMLKTCVVGVRTGTHPSESTWQNILKSVFATIVSTSQFVKSQGIDDVASRLQGLIDGVIESSNANHEQLNHEVSNQKPHPANTNESQNSNK